MVEHDGMNIDAANFRNLMIIHNKSLSIIKEQSENIKNISETQSTLLKLLTERIQNQNISGPLYTAKGVLHSDVDNWFIPFGKFTEACLTCKYYGHSFKTCPNIQPSFLGSCLRCWCPEHDIRSCKFDKRDPPFKSGYIAPEDLIKIAGKGFFSGR